MNEEQRQQQIQKRARDLYSHARGDAQRLSVVAAQYAIAAADKSGGSIDVVGGVSIRSEQPFVQFDWGTQTGQLDVDAARNHAALILEACTNAVADAALYHWARDEMKLEPEQAAAMIDALRRYRADKWGQPDLEIEFSKRAPDEPEQET